METDLNKLKTFEIVIESVQLRDVSRLKPKRPTTLSDSPISSEFSQLLTFGRFEPALDFGSDQTRASLDAKNPRRLLTPDSNDDRSIDR